MIQLITATALLFIIVYLIAEKNHRNKLKIRNHWFQGNIEGEILEDLFPAKKYKLKNNN